MYLLLFIFYAVYLVIASIVMAIFWGIAKLIYKNIHMKRWHWMVCALILALPLIYFAVGTLYHKLFFDRKGFIERRIEWATKVDFPDFEIKEYIEGGRAFNGDYMDEYVLEFKEVPKQEFYDRIEALCNETDSLDDTNMRWRKIDSTHYYWGGIWGNGTPNPDGIQTEDTSIEEDADMSVDIEKGAREFTVSEGRW